MLDRLLEKLVADADGLLEQRLRVTKEIDKLHQAMWGNRIVEIWYTPIESASPVMRLVEPYSFRRLPYGLMFYGWDIREGRTKSFYADRIRAVRIQPRTFKPRWDVEPESIRSLAEHRSKNPFPISTAVLEEGDKLALLVRKEKWNGCARGH